MTKKRRSSRLAQQIDENLRRVYSDALDEPLPERFTRLLEQLRAQENDTTTESEPNERPAEGEK